MVWDKTVKHSFAVGLGTLGHQRKQNPREGWLIWLERIHSPRTEEIGNGKKSKYMYEIKERNQKPLNFQVSSQSLNHGKWNGKGIYQARGTINSSFQDIEGTA